MLVKTILNKCYSVKGFIYGKTYFKKETLIIELNPRLPKGVEFAQGVWKPRDSFQGIKGLSSAEPLTGDGGFEFDFSRKNNAGRIYGLSWQEKGERLSDFTYGVLFMRIHYP